MSVLEQDGYFNVPLQDRSIWAWPISTPIPSSTHRSTAILSEGPWAMKNQLTTYYPSVGFY